MSRSRCTCRSPILPFDDAPKVVDGDFAAPHFEKCPYNGAHHVSEESVSLNNEGPLRFGGLLPSCLKDSAKVGLHVGMQLAEAGEVGIVEQRLCGSVHGFEVERMPQDATLA